MWNSFLDGIVLFAGFIWLTLLLTAASLAGLAIACRSFSWQTRFRGLYGFFTGRSPAECRYLAAVLLQFSFLLSCAATGAEMEPAHFLFLLMLAAWKGICGKRPGVFLRDLVNSALLFAALLVGNVLRGYLRETRFNLSVVLVLILLMLFLCLYGLYFALKDMTAGIRPPRPKKKGRSRRKKKRAERLRAIGDGLREEMEEEDQ